MNTIVFKKTPEVQMKCILKFKYNIFQGRPVMTP